MPAPATIDDFLAVIRKSNQLDADRLSAFLDERRQNATLPPEPRKLAALLVREGLLTNFQADQFLQGKFKGFHIGGYRLLERLGSGGTGTVYLAEHEVMKRRAAIKVLPPSLASDPAILERFRREAQAAAVLDHPNIVRAYDFRHEGAVNFLVMEYIEGPSLEDVMQRKGPLKVEVACEYIRQAAIGLAHAHEAGLVHRDIKPGNLLVDASGTLKILDLGLARMQVEGQESVTKKFDENMVMGTADYLAPEQALNLHEVDHRADIYSLGVTLYALLAGEPPFHAGTVTQKLLWHQMRDPKPLTERRDDIPDEVADLVTRMMAKTPAERFQTCHELVEAITPFCGESIPQSSPRLGKSSGGNTSPYVKASAVPGPNTRRRKGAEDDYDDLEEMEKTPVPRPASIKPASTRRRKKSAAVSPSSTMKRHQREDDEEPRRREIPNLRKPANNSQMAGLMTLGAVMAVILVVVFGVIGFLVWGTGPRAGSRNDIDRGQGRPFVPGPPPPGMNPPAQPTRPPASAGYQFELRDGNDAVERVAFASDGKRVVTAGADRTIRVWDLDRRRVVNHIGGHGGPVTFVTFNEAGSRVLSAGQDGTARIHELPTGQEVKSFSTPGKRIWCARYAMNESQVVTGGDDPVIRVWDVNSGKLLREIPGHTDAVNGLAIRTRHNHALAASWDRSLKLWNLNDGKEVRSFPDNTAQVATCASTVDEKLVASGSYDGKVRLYQEDGKPLHTFSDARGAVWFVTFSLDTQRLAAGSVDGNIYVYNMRSRQLEHRFEGHTKGVTGVSFATDGKLLATSSQDGSVRVWALPPIQR